jgi:phosphoribosylaminoimidazolecarboxamide formyltransferase / IMP cyclohydrolase
VGNFSIEDNMANIRKMYFEVVEDHFPEEMTIAFGAQKLRYRKRTWKIHDPDKDETTVKGLRYGENPDQEAALYELVEGDLELGDLKFVGAKHGLVSALSEAEMIQFGKHPGKINLTDVDNALNILRYLTTQPAVAIMKHNNPSGVAQADSLADAYTKAYMADRIAAMGGAVVVNRTMDRATAEAINATYVEVVAAPEFEGPAIELLQQRKNLRIIKIPGIANLEDYRKLQFIDIKSLIDGGIVVQHSQRNHIKNKNDLQPASARAQGQQYTIKRMPTKREYDDMVFGWAVEMGVSSNSVIYVKDGVTVGIGTGEQDRVGVAEIAVYKAYVKYADALCWRKHQLPYWELVAAIRQGERPASAREEIDAETKAMKGGLIDSVMISDAFFPFRDGVEVGIREGVSAVLQPGGGMRDYEVIEACNEANPPVAMMFTGQRVFKH